MRNKQIVVLQNIKFRCAKSWEVVQNDIAFQGEGGRGVSEALPVSGEAG